MDDPIKQFASLLDIRMVGHANRAVTGVPCELGTITASGLKLDSFKHEIKDYLVADWLAKMYLPAFSIAGSGTATGTGTQSGLKDSLGGSVTPSFQGSFTFEGVSFDFNPTVIDQVHLELKADLKPGDRVLAVPVNGGQDAVVICKVVS